MRLWLDAFNNVKERTSDNSSVADFARAVASKELVRRTYSFFKHSPWSPVVFLGTRLKSDPTCHAEVSTAKTSHFDGLNLVSQRLPEISSSLEREFLALGMSLEKLPDACQKLVDHSDVLVGLASGQASGGSPFVETIAIIEPALAHIERAQADLEAMVQRLDGAINGVERMIAAETLLRRAVAPLTYVRMNFKIESATLGHEVQQMFLALTEDIERLHEQVQQTLSEKFSVLRGARETIVALDERMKSELRQQGAMLRAKREQVATAVRTLSEELRVKGARDTQIASVSRAIRDQVARMVMSLQAQDMASQKLSHALQSVEEARRRAGAWRGTALGRSGGGDIAFAVTACRLQDSQLSCLEQELLKTSREVTGVVAGIRAQVFELDGECLRLSDVEGLSAGMNGMVQLLLDVVEEIRAIMRSSLKCTESACKSIQPVGGMASNLTGVMRRLSAEIHLIALNAQVQAAYHCGGTGLEVLASSTAMISMETCAVSENVAGGVDGLIKDFNRMVEEFEQIHRTGVEQRDRLESDFADKEVALHQARDRMLAELTTVGGCLHEVTALMDAMNHDGDGTREICNRLAGVRGVLATVAEVGDRALESAGVPLDMDRFSAELSRTYSSASEHEVHRAFFGGAPASAMVSDATVLFDEADTARRSGNLVAPEPTSPALSGDTLLVLTDSGGTTAETTRPPAEKTLGDNVELF